MPTHRNAMPPPMADDGVMSKMSDEGKRRGKGAPEASGKVSL